MPLESTEEKQSQKRRIGFVPFQESPSGGFKELSIVIRTPETVKFFYPCITMFASFMFDNCAVKLFFGLEVPKDNRLIDSCLSRKVAGRRTPKSLLSKDLHRRLNDLLPAILFHK